MDTMKRSLPLVILLIYLSMLAAVVVSGSVFDHLPHLEDEYAYLYQARIFERGDIVIETPIPRRAYWQPFLVDHEGKRFGKYPPGWPLLLATGTATDMPFSAAMWIAGLNVALAYRLARDLYGETAGLIAALLMVSSPIALLLNGTLMSHTAALLWAQLFVYGLWRLEHARHPLRWGILSGSALGMLIATRPLAAVGIGAVFILYSAGRVLLAAFESRSALWRTFKPLAALGICTLLLGGLWPLFNYVATGDATQNTYLLIWDYDKIGFGDDVGRNGHTLEKGIETTRIDSACFARDLFGWVMQPDAPPSIPVLRDNECMADQPGISWILLPFAIFVRRRWSALLILSAAILIVVHAAYWIGAGVYSARYYFEAVGLLAVASAGGLTAIAQFAQRWGLQAGVYMLFGIIVAMTWLGYTPDRVQGLEDFGGVSQDLINDVEALRRGDDRPVMVVVLGDHHWREVAPLMAITDPYAENEVILLRDPEQSYLQTLRNRYPQRQLILMNEGRLIAID